MRSGVHSIRKNSLRIGGAIFGLIVVATLLLVFVSSIDAKELTRLPDCVVEPRTDFSAPSGPPGIAPTKLDCASRPTSVVKDPNDPVNKNIKLQISDSNSKPMESLLQSYDVVWVTTNDATWGVSAGANEVYGALEVEDVPGGALPSERQYMTNHAWIGGSGNAFKRVGWIVCNHYDPSGPFEPCTYDTAFIFMQIQDTSMGSPEMYIYDQYSFQGPNTVYYSVQKAGGLGITEWHGYVWWNGQWRLLLDDNDEEAHDLGVSSSSFARLGADFYSEPGTPDWAVPQMEFGSVSYAQLHQPFTGGSWVDWNTSFSSFITQSGTEYCFNMVDITWRWYNWWVANC